MVGRGAIPPSIMRLESVMGPAHTGILVAYDDALAGEAHSPHLRGVDVLHIPLHCLWAVVRAIGGRGVGSISGVVNTLEGAIGLDLSHVGTSGEGLHQGAITADHQRVSYPKP